MQYPQQTMDWLILLGQKTIHAHSNRIQKDISPRGQLKEVERAEETTMLASEQRVGTIPEEQTQDNPPSPMPVPAALEIRSKRSSRTKHGGKRSGAGRKRLQSKNKNRRRT